MPSFTRESGGTLHVAVMGVNRIGKERTIISGISRVTSAGWIGFFAISTFIFVVGGIVARGISRPAKALVDGVKAVASGELGIRLDMNRSDEIGQIATGFDRMVEHFNKKMPI